MTTPTFSDAAVAWAVRGSEESRLLATELARDVSSVILVEGVSDATAVETLATRQGTGLEGLSVIPMGGVTNVAKFLRILGPSGLGLRLAGLCDIDREEHFRQALARGGYDRVDSVQTMAQAGFFVCVRDLEDELIRALGHDRVLEILEEQDDARLFRTFQNQPAQRVRTLERQLRRFFGTTAGRKERYAKILVDGLGDRVPQPLIDVVRFAE